MAEYVGDWAHTFSFLEGKAIPLFFFRLASNAFPDFGSVGRIVKKKNTEKKNHKKSRNRSLGGPGTQGMQG